MELLVGFLLRQELSSCRYRRLEIEDTLLSLAVKHERIYGILSLNLYGISIKRWMVFFYVFVWLNSNQVSTSSPLLLS